MPNTSKLTQMKVCNFGCIGAVGLTIDLDDIVCLVGPNNSGKSTILRAYKAAVDGKKLTEHDFHGDGKTYKSASVELWIHIPVGAENIDEKWKEKSGDLLLVRSIWTWEGPNTSPVRRTWNPAENEYAEDGKASGLDNVFTSRLPRPFHIGSLENPEEEHDALLKLVLEPVIKALNASIEKADSGLAKKIGELKDEANKPLEPFKALMAKHGERLNRSYQKVFGGTTVSLDLSLGNLGIDLASALVESSTVKVSESDGHGHWRRQGTGSQRALFWSMLEIRSELMRLADHREKTSKAIKSLEKELSALEKKLPGLKTDKAKEACAAEIETAKQNIAEAKDKASKDDGPKHDGFLPGHMLLIDEPETALHPSAIRGARDHLYSLAAESGWQVMLTTHHPAFVDPAKDHTTIVRINREKGITSPKVYRSDVVKFSPEEKAQLQSLLAFDMNIAEIFFGGPTIIVEGDTEYACFNAIMASDVTQYPPDHRPNVIRARGKPTIPIILRMLTHFKVDFAILHDIDAPFTADGNKSGPYGVNDTIAATVAAARKAGIKVIHRCSCPNLEVHHGMMLPKKDKPLSAWREMHKTPAIKDTVKAILDDLKRGADSAGEDSDGAKFTDILNEWIIKMKTSDVCFVGKPAK